MGMLLRRHYANRHTEGVTKEVAPSTSSVKSEEKKVEEKPRFTAEEINAMNGTRLRKLAKENGIEDPEDLTVGEIRAILIEKFS